MAAQLDRARARVRFLQHARCGNRRTPPRGGSEPSSPEDARRWHAACEHAVDRYLRPAGTPGVQGLPQSMSLRSLAEVTRWSRAALLLLPLVMGSALVGGAVSSRQRTHEASELLIRGQVDGFVRSLAQAFRSAEGIPAEDVLADALAELEGDGLRYIGLLDRSGAVRVEAGKASATSIDLSSIGSSRELIRLSDRMRVLVKLPPLGHARVPRSRPPRRANVWRLPPWLALEFEPVVADRLRKDADRAFVLSVIAAVALMAIAGVVYWQWRKRELLAASQERERRLAQLGEMSAVLAHEMRNPLASLKGHAQLLLERAEPDSRDWKKLERIVSEAKRLEQLSGTLLDFVRSGSIEPEPVKVLELARQAAADAGAQDPRISSSGPLERSVMLDPLRMNQVLVNLVQNAIEASGAEQPVEVDVELRGKTLLMRIRDHGPGLPPGQEAKIFDAFHTSKTHGTGLGLAIARRIVELHGGTLTAHNHAESGAVFVIELPVHWARPSLDARKGTS